jgi:hemoglobin
MSENTVPTVYEWAGGASAFERLTTVFYRRVLEDPILYPLFAKMSPDHPKHVALWLAEVFGGPQVYTNEHGGYPHMLSKHHNLGLKEEQRVRWVQLIASSADEAGLPTDPEFRSAFIAYLEWGTRIAISNSQPGATPPPQAPVPRWGWGEAPPLPPYPDTIETT